MKVLLKNNGTRLFLKDSARWTGSSADALDFKTAPAAMDYSLMHAFHDISIVLKFSDTHNDVELKNCC
jgi:hypothetical protein